MTGLSTPKWVEETPPVMPLSQAQVMASWAQWLAGTSQKGFSQSPGGLPAIRWRTVTTWARVVLAPGEKWVELTPFIRSFS